MEDKVNLALLMLAKQMCKDYDDASTLIPGLALLMQLNELTEAIVYTFEKCVALALKNDDPGAQRLLSTIKPDMDEAFGRALEQIALANRLQAAVDKVAP